VLFERHLERPQESLHGAASVAVATLRGGSVVLPAGALRRLIRRPWKDAVLFERYLERHGLGFVNAGYRLRVRRGGIFLFVFFFSVIGFRFSDDKGDCLGLLAFGQLAVQFQRRITMGFSGTGFVSACVEGGVALPLASLKKTDSSCETCS